MDNRDLLEQDAKRMAALERAATAVTDAWEALPGGDYPAHTIQSWIDNDLSPAIRALRAALEKK